ncbi:MAG TPA: DUF748 domain-containing protein [Planctomycetota bacterium]|nr:DUF748 domain-containing protein [Planctomycetota bacterium]
MSKTPGKWRRRLRRLAVGLVVTVLVARMLLALLLPWIVQLGAGAVGLDASYRSASLSLLGLSVCFEDLEVRVAEFPDDPPLLRAQEVVADLAMAQLLRGNLGVVDAAVDGARVELQRDGTGRLHLPAAWTAGAAAPAAEQPSPPVPPEPTPVRFDLPLQVASARVHDLQLRFHDAAATPPVHAELTLDADVTDLGRTDRAGAIDVRLHAPQWFDDLWLEASTTTTSDRLQVSWQVHLRGLRPAALPLRASTPGPLNVDVVSLALRGELRGHTVADAPRRPTLAGELEFEVELDGRPQLAGELTAGPCRNTKLGVDLPFSVQLHGDELVDDLRLQDGLVQIAPEHLTLTTQLAARGIGLALLEPWLAQAGVQLPKGGLDATANCSAAVHTVAGTGTSSMTAEVTQFSLGAGDERVGLARLCVADLRTTGGELAIGSVEVDGPELAIVAREHALSVAGLRFVTPAAAPRSASPTPPPASAPASGPAMPRLSLGKLDWRGLRVAFTDASLAEPATLTLADGTVTAERLVFGRDEPPGHLTATCRVPDSAGELRAELTFTPAPHKLAVEAMLSASEVTAAGLEPWLRPLGVQPVLEHGSFSMVAAGEVAVGGGALEATARLGKVRCTDGELVLASLRNLELRGLRIGATGCDLGTLTIDEPFLAVSRPTPEAMRVLGFELRQPPAPPAAAAPAEAAPAAPPAAPGTPLRRGPVTLKSGVVRWTGAAGQPLSLGADLTLGADDGSGAPVPIEATCKLGEAIEALQVRGTVCTAPSSFRLESELEGHGLRGAAMVGLLPPHVTCTLADGSVHASLRAEFGASPTPSVHVRVQDVRLMDRGEELAAIDGIEVQAPELSADLVHVAKLEVRGVRAVTGSTVEGLHVPGFLLRPAPAAKPAATAPDAAPASTAKVPLVPALRIDAIDVAAERLVWRQRLQQDGEPLVASVHVALDAPWATTDDFAETPPANFTVTASVEPICREVHLTAALRPFELQPAADLTLRAEGIDTTGLTRLVPDLADRLQGTVTDARFAAEVHATLGLRRRNPRQFDLGRPFGGELLVDKVEYAASPAGPTIASIESIEIQARNFDPRSGDLLLRTLSVDAPRLQAHHTAAGTELLGVRLLAPAAAATPAPPPPAAPAAGPAAAEAAAPGPAASTAPEFAIDRLQVQGLAFTFTDDTTEPATNLPLEDVEVELRRFSTRALSEPRRVHFEVAVHGGEVTLEKRVVASSAIMGFLTSTVGSVAGSGQPEFEERPLLDELSVAGNLTLYPTATGTMRCVIRSFELPALRGLAKAGGVDLTDGLLDVRLDATLAPSGVDVDNHTTFTWLSLSEPPGGPISTYLRLPAPLDTVLFLLRNESDEHQLPMRLHVPAEGMDSAAIAGAAAESVLKVVTDAITGAATRATGAVTGVLGLGGGPDLRALATTATFAPGDPAPQAGDLSELLAAVGGDPELRIVLTHELGAGDLARAAELANPPPAVVAETVRRLQRERGVAMRRRSELAAEVAARFGAGQMHEARREQDELSRVDDGLGRLELTLDEALGMLTPDPRAADRRTRRASLALAEARLQALAELLRRRLPDPGRLIEQRRPRPATAADLPGGGRILITVRRGKA